MKLLVPAFRHLYPEHKAGVSNSKSRSDKVKSPAVILPLRDLFVNHLLNVYGSHSGTSSLTLILLMWRICWANNASTNGRWYLTQCLNG